MNVGIVALSGYNTRAVIAFCRYLSRQGMSLHLWAKDKTDPLFYTKYKNWIFSTREKQTLDISIFIKFINSVKNSYGYNKILVLPTSEYLNRFLLKHREFLEENNLIIPLAEKALYESVSNKYSFSILCNEHGLKVPNSTSFERVEYPIVAKPKYYCSTSNSQLKPYIIDAEDDFLAFQKNNNTEDYYLQEYIPGKSYYLMYYISHRNNVTALSQENLIQQSGGGSIIAAKSSDIHRDAIGDNYANFLIKIGFHGLIMIEVKKHNNDYYMIEANPRLWGPLQLVVDLGGDILGAFLSDSCANFMHTNSTENNHTIYFWSGGIVRDQMNSKKQTFYNIKPTDVFNNYGKFICNDILLRQDTLDLYLNETVGNLST